MEQQRDDDLQSLQRRVELLEAENQRLRERMEPILGPYNPCFDPPKFARILAKRLVWIMLPVYLLGFGLPFGGKYVQRFVPPMSIGGLPLIDTATSRRHPGIGIGVIGAGGLGLGVIGIGGLGAGVIAIGGGAIGLIAVGGGSIGLVAIGGGAVGWIALGGGAAGRWVLAQRGAGKYVLALNRQDDQAVEFFCRYFPALRAACTRPMEVIPLEKSET